MPAAAGHSSALPFFILHPIQASGIRGSLDDSYQGDELMLNPRVLSISAAMVLLASATAAQAAGGCSLATLHGTMA